MPSVESVKIECEDRGFELHLVVGEEPFVDENGWMVLNIHSCAVELLKEVQRTIGPWWNEGQSALAEMRRTGFHCNPDESGGYALDDPKHPTWADRMAGFYDNQNKTEGLA